jgi:caa(3)-type oxidase subunit IV
MTATTQVKHPVAGGLRSITIAWFVLCVITIVSWWLSPAHSDAPATPSLAITLAVIGLGIVKCRLIIRYFMEVNSAPRWLRLATDAWVILFWISVLAIYLY